MKISNTTAPAEQKHQLHETASSAVSSQVRAMFGRNLLCEELREISCMLDIMVAYCRLTKLISFQKFPVHGRQLFSFMYGRHNILHDLHLKVILLIRK